jgi:hypothetical protein
MVRGINGTEEGGYLMQEAQVVRTQKRPSGHHYNRRALELAQEWLPWLETRKFMAPPPVMGVLGRLTHISSGRQPNAGMSAEMAAFHLAVVSLEVGYLIPFLDVYVQSFPDPVKSLLAEIGLTDRSAFYYRAHKAAGDVVKTTNRLLEMNSAVRAETKDAY